MGKHLYTTIDRNDASSHPLLCNIEDNEEYMKNLDTDEIQGSREFNRNRHQVHRRTRRLTRFFAISLGLLVLWLLIYIPIFNSIHSRTMALPGWGYNASKLTADYILPNVDTAILEPRSVCLSNFFLLVVVCSSVHNFAQRQTIRETWGNTSEFNYPMFSKLHSHMAGQYLNVKELNIRMHSSHLNIPNITEYSNFTESLNNHIFPVRVVFLIGRDESESYLGNETIARLKLESEQYDDLIQENFIDSYNNLTIKSVMMLKWIQQKCLNRAKFVVKCDDDTFVNIPNLLHVLLGGTIPVYNDTVEFYDARTVNALAPSNRMLLTQNLLTGYLFCNVKPVSDVTSKWYTPLYMYSGDTYPKYLSGSGYLMSADVVGKLLNASLNVSILHLEDVYITGICAEKVHIKRKHNSLFSFHHSKSNCSYKGTITQHYLKGDQMREIYSFVSNVTILCPRPDRYFKVKRLKYRPKSCV